MAAGIMVKGTVILDLVKQVRAAKDKDWKTVHSVTLPGGGSTDSILRSLKRF